MCYGTEWGGWWGDFGNCGGGWVSKHPTQPAPLCNATDKHLLSSLTFDSALITTSSLVVEWTVHHLLWSGTWARTPSWALFVK